ncbi:MAG: IclR family transcriptional regulator [Ilumatobacteraceae bacterium]
MLSGVGVLDKAVAVLRALESAGPLSLVELQENTGLPRATAHRLAAALTDHGLVRRDESGLYVLGWALVGLGRAAMHHSPLLELAAPIMNTVRRDTGESVQLYVREGDMRRCVLSLESPHGLRWIVPEGALLPLSVGSAGRVLDGAPLSKGGWVASVGEREAGVASVSAPVLDASGQMVAVLSVSGPIERLTRKPGDRHGAKVVAAARKLSVELRRSPRR